MLHSVRVAAIDDNARLGRSRRAISPTIDCGPPAERRRPLRYWILTTRGMLVLIDPELAVISTVLAPVS